MSRMKSDGTVKPKAILSLLHRQRFRCAYTGDPLTPDDTSLDHRLPVARGGGHAIDNLCLVTRAVNAAKGTMTVDEFVGMCRRVVRHFGDAPVGTTPPLAPETAGELSGATDPVEILTTLGYLDAAARVVGMKEAVASLRRNAYSRGQRRHRQRAREQVLGEGDDAP